MRNEFLQNAFFLPEWLNTYFQLEDFCVAMEQ